MSADKQNHSLLLGTLTLTASGLAARFAGFFYRIYLSRKLTAEAMGLYQLVYPLYSICFSLCCASFQTALSRFGSARISEALRRTQPAISGMRTAPLSFPCFSCIHAPVSVCSMDCFSHSGGYAMLSASEDHGLVRSVKRRPFLYLRLLLWEEPCLDPCLCTDHGTACPNQHRHDHPIPRRADRKRNHRLLCCPGTFRRRNWCAPHQFFLLSCRTAQTERFQSRLYSHAFRIAEAFPQGPARDFSFPASSHPSTHGKPDLFEPAAKRGNDPDPVQTPSFWSVCSDALSLYGVFTGMAFPFVLFPTALTGSLSVMLLPHIARAQSEQAYDSISTSASVSIRCSLILGILFSGLFLHYGTAIGTTLFRNETAGILLKILAWLCPFLYVSGTMASILNGLGYTKITFLHNLAGLTLRFTCVLLIVPFLGIRGYLYGLLAGELLLTVCHLRFLCRKGLLFSFSFFQEIFRPVFCVLISSGIIKRSRNAFLFFCASAPRFPDRIRVSFCFLLWNASVAVKASHLIIKKSLPSPLPCGHGTTGSAAQGKWPPDRRQIRYCINSCHRTRCPHSMQRKNVKSPQRFPRIHQYLALMGASVVESRSASTADGS